jgi:hypothetical protein
VRTRQHTTRLGRIGLALGLLSASLAFGGSGSANAAGTLTPPVFGAPVHVDDACPGAEPSLKIGPDGTLWITAPNGPGLATGAPAPHSCVLGDLVWSSSDHGSTWALHTTPEPILSGGDADVWVSPQGQIFVGGLDAASLVAPACISVAASVDNAGTAFNTQPLMCGASSAILDDREWLVTTNGGADLWNAFGSSGDIYVEHAKVLPAGTIVPDQAPIQLTTTNSGPDAYLWPGYLTADQQTGDVYVTWNTNGDDVHDASTVDKLVVARVHPDGSVTRAEIPAAGDTFDSFTGIDIDRQGNLYLVWNERRGTSRTDTLISYSRDHGTTWSTPLVVNSQPVQTTVFPWVAAGDAGRVDVAYYGTTTGGFSPERVPATAQWDVYVAQSLNLFSTDPLDPPTFSEVKATPASMHRSGICTSGTGCGTADRDLLDYFMIDVDSNGMAAIAYAEDGSTATAQIRFLRQTGGSSVFAPPA